jgi:NAD(P)-dependent dehydrogenase (short-subunit alcohol dehydrogenase family)
MMEIAGRVAVVTGASSGIGKGSALALARAGAKIVIADIDLAKGEQAAAEIKAEGGDALAVECDVGRDGEFEKLRDLTLDAFGGVDIVMNNAGVISSGLPEDVPLEEWQRVFNINLMSAVRSNGVFLPIFLKQGFGHIVNTASFAGLYTYAFDRLPYAASKAAIFQMSEGLALYLKPKGIGVTVLCPGPVRTNIMQAARVFSTDVQIRAPGRQFDLLTADAVGEMVVDAIRKQVFFLPTHPQVQEILVRRAGDFDAYLQSQIDNPHIVDLPKRN